MFKIGLELRYSLISAVLERGFVSRLFKAVHYQANSKVPVCRYFQKIWLIISYRGKWTLGGLCECFGIFLVYCFAAAPGLRWIYCGVCEEVMRGSTHAFFRMLKKSMVTLISWTGVYFGVCAGMCNAIGLLMYDMEKFSFSTVIVLQI